MKSQKYYAFALVLAIALVFSACGPSPSTEETAADSAAPVEESTGPVKISVYSVAWSPSSINMMKDLIEKFNQEHEGEIMAEFVQGDWGEGDTYITSGVAGGGGIADVIEWYLGGALDWYNQGYALDLSPYVTDEVRASMPELLWQARTAPDGAIFESCTVAGEHFVNFFNPELIRNAGIEPPAAGETWTWDEFIENAKLLTLDASGKHIGEDGFDPNNVVQWGYVPRLDDRQIYENIMYYSLQSAKKPMIRKGDDGMWDIFFDEESMPAIEAFTSIISEGITPMESIGLVGSTQDEMFFQGQAAIVPRGYFNIAVLIDNYPDFEFGVMPIAMEDGSNYFASPEVGQGFSVPVTTKHPKEAAEFVFWFQRADNQALWMNALMLDTCNPAAYDEPVIKDNPLFDVMRFYKGIENYVEAEVNPNVDEFQTTVFGTTMMEVMMGNMSLDDGIAQIKAISKDVLNQ